ncbi:MAG: carbon-nitrogen hydrolase family protein [Helicobacteraceae bacterium]|jgi:predicted amidohydrolase|nr:carbon-nitrogen hydrolase family protein [Helicobacteraceae bacterium]
MRKEQFLRVAILQIGELALNSARLEYFLTQSKERGASVVLLPEYVCNLFFSELLTAPPEFAANQGETQYKDLAKLAKIYRMTIVAPLIRAQNGKFYKSVYRFAPDKIYRYDQRLLMPYPHWNEAAFFANETFDGAALGQNAQNGQNARNSEIFQKLLAPRVFTIAGFKIAVFSGYELHFDLLWHRAVTARIDAALVPSVGTFESFARWQTLAKSRSFTGGCYVARANRIGAFEGAKEKRGETWEFYGNSFFCSPFGEIEDSLDEMEGILIAEFDREMIKEARKSFRFAATAKSLDPPLLRL